MKLKYLITGTGRCGTVYFARFLTHLKIYCGHEAIFDYTGLEEAKKKLAGELVLNTSNCSLFNEVKKQETKDWFDSRNLSAESSYMAAPFLGESILNDVTVIHLIRNPFKVLSSWVLDMKIFSDQPPDNFKKYKNFILEHVPKINKEKTEIERACRYIIEWNKLIELCQQRRVLIKIEDYPYNKFLNIHSGIDRRNLFPNILVNSWNEREYDLSLYDIPKGNTRTEFLQFAKNFYQLNFSSISFL